MREDEIAGLTEALPARAKQALQLWDLADQTPKLLKFRENAVFQVRLADGKPAALRLHRPGYHDDRALASELQWMAALEAGGLHVPAPIPALDGNNLVRLPATPAFASQHADIVSWMSGEELGQSGAPLCHSPDRIETIFGWLGEAMAELHTISDRWTPPASFTRPAWDFDGLLGDSPLWGRFWDCPGLTSETAAQLEDLRLLLGEKLRLVEQAGLDYGLIHADLVRENVLIAAHGVELIDFDDAGYGWRMFDIATALLRNRREPCYDLIRSALIAGYRRRRPLSDAALETLPLFLLLRSLTYIGWVGARPDMPDAQRRVTRYIKEVQELATAIR
ncbi:MULTISPECIES: phosphotransferase enzyme family protein [unclassified Rhizobium]|uniref:phosphotransferase enzyme family protein n=1 Tax=unclassified Rhizobium TaxID=2613769 RepID=UPI0007EAE134|nr:MULTISPECIES: phosphotransferase [unclassified Rhizobium]ANM12975.1 aminoglycoside phosphotransferase protein [Rhizobium sp. N324]OYD01436.1 aminoglycoside phosphotransferase protein [Rhizobium sp. N4311]